MRTSTQNFLQNFGLNQKDIRIYMDIYQHDHSFASSIAMRTGIDRTTIYSIIKKLLGKGLISQTKVKEVSAYTALPPEVFLDKIDIEAEELESRRRAAKNFISDIRQIKKHSFARPKVQIFEGAEAIKNLYEQTLTPSTEQKAFLTIETMPAELADFLKHTFVKSKIKKRVQSRVILADSPAARHYQSLDPKSNRQTRLVTRLPFDIASEILLYDAHKVAIIDFNKKPFGLLIESKTFRRTMESLFEFVWGNKLDN